MSEHFKRWSRQKQQRYHKHFGKQEWSQFKPPDYNNLKKMIGYAFFNSPNLIGEKEEAIYRPTPEQNTFIDKIFQLILRTKEKHSNKNTIWLSFTLVCCSAAENLTEVHVVRVPEYDPTSSTNTDMFIDSCFRVYKNWQDFLDNNKLPECIMYYPKGGTYFNHNEGLELEMTESPQANIGSKIKTFLDMAMPEIQKFAGCGGISSTTELG
ncbi:hypothetical protein L9F63_017243, partial [Diploptera punctata]